jgi:hypothetical protein
MMMKAIVVMEVTTKIKKGKSKQRGVAALL